MVAKTVLFIAFLFICIFQLNGQELMVESAPTESAKIQIKRSNSSGTLSLTASNDRGQSYIRANNGVGLNIAHGNDSRIYIGTDGKIGIGSTTPLEQLYIHDGGITGEELKLSDLSIIKRKFGGNSMTFNHPNGFIFNINSNNVLDVDIFKRIKIGDDFSSANRSSDDLRLKNSGKAGIRNVMAIIESRFSNSPFILFRDHSNSNSLRKGMAMGYRRSGSRIPPQLQFITKENKVAVTFHDNGNVGFATVSPEYKADVNGSVRVIKNIRLKTKEGAPVVCKTDTEGTIYFDKNTSKLRVCTIENNNYKWVNLN